MQQYIITPQSKEAQEKLDQLLKDGGYTTISGDWKPTDRGKTILEVFKRVRGSISPQEAKEWNEEIYRKRYEGD